ncbi:MAG TPA: efflux RND transporter periplasmic adaptor subunit [Pirellulaceae bacterium]|nr:efflux RND transporter periplasmic adaptor subunit [Pirellulaceae bacterium]
MPRIPNKNDGPLQENLPNQNSTAAPPAIAGELPNVAANTPISVPSRVSLRTLIWELSKLVFVPMLILASFIVCLIILGVAQRTGWLTSDHVNGETGSVADTNDNGTSVSYICPMMCVPPTTKPGRCPVCGMELVPAAAVSTEPSTKIEIDPRSRRIAGIRTVKAESRPLVRKIRGVGSIQYDETKLKTLSAYFDSRVERLFADFTGITVEKGDALALVYSPELYAAQVEFTRALSFLDQASANNRQTDASARQLLNSAQERLTELGMTAEQIEELRQSKQANRRLNLYAPISGTVIEKLAVTGQYLQAGSPIYRLADLSTVWLVVQVFPDDAALIQVGHEMTASTQSMSGQPICGVVDFIEPNVDEDLRTVGVRMIVDNRHGQFRPGEFARATIEVPVLNRDGTVENMVTVPRNSLLSIGETSLLYVETKPGEFHLRRVVTGPASEGMVAILEGLSAGENVVAQSTFLLDAQMQLQGNPSLIDPNKAVTEIELSDAELAEIDAALAPLSAADRDLAEAQVICPVMEVRLGSMGMGTPIKLEVLGTNVFICCEGCRNRLVAEPERYLQVLQRYHENKSLGQADSASGKQPEQSPHNDTPSMKIPPLPTEPQDLPRMDPPK